MREIKFRFFYKGLMKQVEDLCLDIGMVVLSTLEIYDVNDGVLVQYTGLKDKNGKEIYEGDIVKTPIDTFEVKYDCNLAGFIAGYCRDEDGDFSEMLSEWNWVEVIGNIYENPELLEESK